MIACFLKIVSAYILKYYLHLDSFDYYSWKTETPRSSVRHERNASKLAYRFEINSPDMQIGKGSRLSEHTE